MVGRKALTLLIHVQIVFPEPILLLYRFMMKIHVCINVKKNGVYTGIFRCGACDFQGPLKYAIEHSLQNQFTVEYKPKPKALPFTSFGRPNHYYETDPR
jgi:hypothetical protein